MGWYYNYLLISSFSRPTIQTSDDSLTLNLQNILNGTIHLLFLELSILKCVSQQYRVWPERVLRLAWLYTGGKG